jgi:LacI family transcriptional regulator
VMSAAAQLGLRVPQDVAVAGFDDSWIAKSVWPYLTTIHQPITEMARRATTLLIDRETFDGSTSDLMLGYEVIVRASTSPGS